MANSHESTTRTFDPNPNPGQRSHTMHINQNVKLFLQPGAVA